MHVDNAICIKWKSRLIIKDNHYLFGTCSTSCGFHFVNSHAIEVRKKVEYALFDIWYSCCDLSTGLSKRMQSADQALCLTYASALHKGKAILCWVRNILTLLYKWDFTILVNNRKKTIFFQKSDIAL